MHHAWHVAALVRQGVANLLDPNNAVTPLADLLSTATPKAPPPAKSAGELQAAVEAWLGPPPKKPGE